MKDYYQILGILPTAGEGDIKTAYRKLAKQYHPDTNKAADAEAKFKEISEAYEVLKDAQKRLQYDAQRTGGYRSNPNFHWSNQPQPDPYMDLDEILKDIRRSKGGFYPQDAKNRDIVLSYAITLEEAYEGKEAEISYVIPGKDQQAIKIKIPAGIQDGIKLRFQGKGDDSMQGVKTGDLYIKISIIPHTAFIRSGPHIATSVKIGYLDALLGKEVEIPTIEGGMIRMRVPAGIHPGQSLRAQGKGMPIGDGRRGDLMVEVLFEAEKLSEEERVALASMRDKRNS